VTSQARRLKAATPSAERLRSHIHDVWLLPKRRAERVCAVSQDRQGCLWAVLLSHPPAVCRQNVKLPQAMRLMVQNIFSVLSNPYMQPHVVPCGAWVELRVLDDPAQELSVQYLGFDPAKINRRTKRRFDGAPGGGPRTVCKVEGPAIRLVDQLCQLSSPGSPPNSTAESAGADSPRRTRAFAFSNEISVFALS